MIRTELADQLSDTCRKWGFFYAENHGVPDALLQRTRSTVDEFFALPQGKKNAIHISKSAYHRGYFPEYEENALGNDEKDLKEGFDMALELPEEDPAVLAGVPCYGPNTWPSEPVDFRPTLQSLYSELRSFCAAVVGLFARSFGLPEEFFVPHIDKPMCQLRVVRYPAGGELSVPSTGCGAHTDYGLVSTIWQMDYEGLEIQQSDETWISAPVIEDTLVCPIGDATEILTNGTWHATVHRVINHPTAVRHATAFFFDPNYDYLISPLDVFISPEHSSAYMPTTMGEHVTSGFDGTFAYRGSARGEGSAHV